MSQGYENTFIIFEIQTWMPGSIMGIKTTMIFLSRAIWSEVTCYHGNDTVIPYSSIDMNLNLNNCLAEIGNTCKTKLHKFGE